MTRDFRVIREDTDDGTGGRDEHGRDAEHKREVVRGNVAHESHRASWPPRAKVLADERRRGIAEPPRRENEKVEDPDRDRIAGDGRAAVGRDDLNE